MKSQLIFAVCTAFIFSLLSAHASADDNMFQNVTPDMRENAAQIHEQMAACLRLEKPFIICRQEMKSACINLLGEGYCKMYEKCSNQTTQAKITRFKDRFISGELENNDTSDKNFKRQLPLKHNEPRFLK